MTQLEKFEEARDHLSGALMQVIDSDDQIIVGHMRSAYELLRDAIREHHLTPAVSSQDDNSPALQSAQESSK